MPTEKININKKRGRTVLKCCSDSELLTKDWCTNEAGPIVGSELSSEIEELVEGLL